MKNTLQKIVDTVNFLAIPVAGAMAIWIAGDWAIYTTAFAGAINGIWAFAKLFVKD